MYERNLNLILMTNLPLKKTLDLSNIIVVKSVFHEGSFLRWIFV